MSVIPAAITHHDAPRARIPLDALRWVGHGLRRPECVLATRAGDLYCADWRGGVAHLKPDGTQALYTAAGPDGITLRPNGIALRRDGSFLLAELGEERGGVYRLTRDGAVDALVTAVDGSPLPPTNFVVEDALGRAWITVSTRQRPRAAAYRREVADGFIVLADAHGARIVADGLGYTNECAVSPDGATELMLEDADEAHVAACERAWLGAGLGRAHLDTAAGRVLKNISSLAFGGPGQRTAYLGCLQGEAIACFTAPVAGAPPAHWQH